MFKIPKWEDDVPKSNVVFEKSANAKNKKEHKLKALPLTVVTKTRVNKSQVNGKTPQQQQSKNKFKKTKDKFNDRKSQTFKKVKDYSVKNKKELANKNRKTSHHLSQETPCAGQRPPPFSTTTGSPSYGKTSNKRKHGNTNNSSFDETSQSSSVSQKQNKPKKRKFQSEIEENPPEHNEIVKDIPIAETLTLNRRVIQPVRSKVDKKKEKFRKVLQMETNRNQINVSGSKLRQRMLERLKAAQFRFLNEKLYTTTGSEAQTLFQSDPEAFQTYHQGYQQQLKKWPVNPLDLIVKRISKMPKSHIIADMGCGEAALSARVPHSVRSFDLLAAAPGVEACDMAHTPLLSASVDAAVYCLALMGTELTQYLVEANRVLKVGGHLLIAEVESRFEKVEAFADEVQRLGFKLKNLDKGHQVFFFMEFVKVRDPPAKKAKLPVLTLKPCLYKKR